MDKYSWTQTLKDVVISVPVPPGTKGRDCNVRSLCSPDTVCCCLLKPPAAQALVFPVSKPLHTSRLNRATNLYPGLEEGSCQIFILPEQCAGLSYDRDPAEGSVKCTCCCRLPLRSLSCAWE